MNIATTRLIDMLKEAGYKPVFIPTTDKQLEDDSINITENIDIQVGRCGRFSVGIKCEDGTLEAYAPTARLENVLRDLKDALPIGIAPL